MNLISLEISSKNCIPPAKIVIDPHLQTPLQSNFLKRNSRRIIITKRTNDSEKIRKLDLLGHVDEIGKLIRIKGNEYFFQVNTKNSKYLIPKGSIGIDGVSLTINTISRNIFSVCLIPFTLNNTTLGNLKIGSFVNIEYDYLVKILIYKTP
ncbi:hypothetical protein ES707_16940 [subsurface metagenome]